MTDRADSGYSFHRHKRQARLFRALGNESRLTMLERLRRGECCVCDLAELTRLDQSTVSRHLSLLSDAGAVEGERRGNHVYYRLAADWVAELLDRGAARAGSEEEAREPQD